MSVLCTSLVVSYSSAVYQLLQTEQAVQCTDSYMMTLGNCNGLGQFIWLIGWMVSVVKLVKMLGCWNQVVRMIYQILDRMDIVS